MRDVERQLQHPREWANRPKPQPIGNPPVVLPDNALQANKWELMFGMILLALVTDATRTVTIKTFGLHHDLSLHGKEPKTLAECRAQEG